MSKQVVSNKAEIKGHLANVNKVETAIEDAREGNREAVEVLRTEKQENKERLV